MQLISRYAAFVLLSIMTDCLLGQIVCNKIYIQNNATVMPDSIKKIDTRAIIFFCPMFGMDSIDSTLYSNRADALCVLMNSNIKQRIKIYYIYYIEDPKNNSNGMRLHNKNQQLEVSISQQTCLLVNFNYDIVKRAAQKYSFEVSSLFEGENLIKAKIIEGKQCFKIIQDRLPFYYDFLKECIYPTYTIDEQLQQVRDSIKYLGDVNDSIGNSMKLLRTEMDSLKTIVRQTTGGRHRH